MEVGIYVKISNKDGETFRECLEKNSKRLSA